MAHDMTPQAARDALASADGSSARLRDRARWAGTKLAVFGLGFGVITAAIGLVESQVHGLAVFAVWGLLVGGMVLWERRRPAHLPGTAARITPYWVLTIVLYAVAVAVASGERAGDLTYWLPAAAIVSAPMLIGALRERRA